MNKPVTINREHAIDAVAMVRRIRDAQAEQIQGMTTEQQIAFYQTKAQELLRKLKVVQQSRSKVEAMPVSDSVLEMTR